MLVCLGSQLQKDPQANLAQTDPVTVARMQNIIPAEQQHKILHHHPGSFYADI